MTVILVTSPSNVIFDVSEDSLQITKFVDGKPSTFVYGNSNSLPTILHELEWLAKHHPGILRLLWLPLVPWSDINELFVRYAKMYGVIL